MAKECPGSQSSSSAAKAAPVFGAAQKSSGVLSGREAALDDGEYSEEPK